MCFYKFAAQVKRGCYDLARETGAPIVLMSYTLAKGREDARRWDKRLLPNAFDAVRLRLSRPYHARDAVSGRPRPFEDVAAEIEGDYAAAVAADEAAEAEASADLASRAGH